MKNKDGIFKFKYFSVRHDLSSMKVGVDGVLVGAWANPEGKRILDVGTGCGIIALMMAQRNPEAEIVAIDVDEPSVREAELNFRESPWGSRLKSVLCSYTDIKGESGPVKGKFDLIVSNPPYFDAGVRELDDSRKIARHQGNLSPDILLSEAPLLLSPGGRVVMVVPDMIGADVSAKAMRSGMLLSSALRVKDHPGAQVKRVLMEFSLRDTYDNNPHIGFDEGEIPVLTMFTTPGRPTDEYRRICKDFYLRF